MLLLYIKMKMFIAEKAEDYKQLTEEEKSKTILVLIRLPDSDMYQVKKGRYKLKLPRYISKDELIDMMLHKRLG